METKNFYIKALKINHTLPELSDDSLELLNYWHCIVALSEIEAIKKVLSMPNYVVSENGGEPIYKNYVFVPIAITTSDPDINGGKEIILKDNNCNFEYTSNIIY